MSNTNLNCYFTDIFGYDDQTKGQKYGDDLNPLIPILTKAPAASPSDLIVWSGDRIDGIQMLYGSTELNMYGKDNGTKFEVPLTPTDPIKSILFYGANNSNGNRLGQMVIGFLSGRSVSFGKTQTTLLGTLLIPEPYRLGGLRAYFGDEINGLGGLLVPPLVSVY